MRGLTIASTLIILLAIIGIIYSAPANSRPQNNIAKGFEVEFTVNPLNMTYTDKYLVVSIEGFSYENTPGHPRIPVKRIFILVPPATIGLSVNVSVASIDKYPIDKPPYPSKPICTRGGCFYKQPVYKGVYPPQMYRVEKEQWLGPYRYIPVVLYPVQFDMDTGTMLYARKYVIRISYSLLPPKNVPRKANEFNWRLAREITYNKWALDLFYNHVDLITDTNPEGYRYIVVTTTDLADAFKPLINWKRAKGIPSTIVTTDYIDSTYTGRNLQEKIRNFAIDMYNNYGLEYLVLGGDYDQVPPLWYYGPRDQDEAPEWTYNTSYKATDLFYALLNGDNSQWDPDGDGLYLEYTSGTDPGGTVDEPLPDKLPDILVGRISGDTYSEEAVVVQKILNYETNITVGSWLKHVVLAGAIANYENEDNSGVARTDAAYTMELIRQNFVEPRGYTYTRLYEKSGLDPSSYTCEHALSLDNFTLVYNSGAGIVLESGHGYHDGHYRKIWVWDDGDGVPETDPYLGEIRWPAFLNFSAIIDNGVYYPVQYLSACLTGMFDYGTTGTRESLAEYMLERSDGSVAVMASARTSFYVPGWQPGDGGNAEFLYYFAKALIYTGINSVDNAFYTSKVWYVNAGFNMDQWWNMKNFLNYNFFGDPELSLWRNPIEINVSYPQVVNVPGNGSVSVEVKVIVTNAVTGDPVPNATVTLWLKNATTEVYRVATTNTSGIAVLYIPGNVTGQYNITVSGIDIIPYTGALSAEAVPAPIYEPYLLPLIATAVGLAGILFLYIVRRRRR